jgi:predicted dehydrogenase
MRTLRVGIVGCGAISGNHIEAYLAQPGVEVVAVCDRDDCRALEKAQAHGIPLAFSEVADMLGAGLDLISVCTPHPTHGAVVREAAEAGVHVMCEKPIDVDLRSAADMVAACRRHDVRLGVVFQRRFWPAAQRVREAVKDGSLGRPVLAHVQVRLHRDAGYYQRDAWRGTWAHDGGGVLMTQAVHYVDLLQWYLGRPVSVQARTASFKHGDYIEVEDTVAAVVTFASGALATLSCSTASATNLGYQIEVMGSTGACVGVREFPEGREGVNHLWAVGDVRDSLAHDPAVEANIDLGRINAQLVPFHALQVAEFVAAVREGRDPAVTGEDGLVSLAVVLAVYESARRGETVRVDDLIAEAGAAEPAEGRQR